MVCVRGSLREGAPRSGGGECVLVEKILLYARVGSFRHGFA